MSWYDYDEVRTEIARVIDRHDIKAVELPDVFHGTVWRYKDGTTAVTGCKAYGVPEDEPEPEPIPDPPAGANEYQRNGWKLAWELRRTGLRLAYPVRSTQHGEVITDPFGVWRTPGNYHHSGLDLKGSWQYWGDTIVSSTAGEVVEAGWHDNQGGFGFRVAVRTSVQGFDSVVVKYAHLVDGSIKVGIGDHVTVGQVLGYPGRSGNTKADHLHIQVDVGTRRADPAVLIKWDSDEPITPPVPLSVGLHDGSGAEWMVQNGVHGVALVHAVVQTVPVGLDFSHYEAAGVQVFLRLNYGYADGTGTIAPPSAIAAHCSALAGTINNARGVAGVHLWNEVNNPVEWPGGYPSPSFVVSPQYVASAYNTVCNLVTVPVLLSPPPIDPYNVVAAEFGQPPDPKVWAQTIYQGAPRIGWIAMHAKTQGSDLGQIDGDESWATFGNPIAGRYQHLRTLEDQIGWIPPDLASRLIYVTELNPQRRPGGALGWGNNGAEWWGKACEYVRGLNRVSGAMAYRYEVAGGGQEGFGLEDRSDILRAIEEHAG